MEDEIRSFQDKIRLKEYTSTKAAFQDMLKGVLQEGEGKERWGEHRYKGGNGNE